MHRLSASALRAVVEVGGVLDEHQSSSALAASLPGLARRLIPCEIAAYNEVNVRSGHTKAVVAPTNAIFEGGLEVLGRYARQNPLIVATLEGRLDQPMRISDFLSRRQYHALDLYHQLYRRAGVEYQMAVSLADVPHTAVGLTLNRGRRDFTERERTQLALMAPRIRAAFAAARRSELLAAAIDTSDTANGGGVIMLDAVGAVALATPGARMLFSELDHAALPSLIADWMHNSPHGQMARPLRLAADDGTPLLAWLSPESTPHAKAIALVRLPGLNPAERRRIGLTLRESDVLTAIAQGTPPGRLAASLGMRPRTVDKHLEHIYAKLGVHDRTQAVTAILRPRSP